MQLLRLLRFSLWQPVFLSLLCAGCGYQVSKGTLGEGSHTVSLPLIRGDEEGYFRNNLAKELSKSGHFIYSSGEAHYRLDVAIVEDKKETVGYAWDQAPVTGAFIKRLYPNEGRRKVKVSVSLVDTVKKKAVVPPFFVSVSTDYDFVNPTALQNVQFKDIHGQVQSVLQYSLGQLDSEEGARQETAGPLSQMLATEIVSALLRIKAN